MWDQLANQSATTLNILRKSRIDKKPAFHQLNGHKYDWNTFPMAPPGTRTVIYISAYGRTSWGARGINTWYCGPSTDHYHNCIFFIPDTGSYRISGSFDLFPQHYLLPEFNPIQHTREVLSELNESVQKLNQQYRKKIIKTIEAAIANLQMINPPQQRVETSTTLQGGQAPQRVSTIAPPITTTTNPTEPATIKKNRALTSGRPGTTLLAQHRPS